MADGMFDAKDVTSTPKYPSSNPLPGDDTNFVPNGKPEFRSKYNTVVNAGNEALFNLRFDGARPIYISMDEVGVFNPRTSKSLIKSAEIPNWAYGLHVNLQTAEQQAGRHVFIVKAKNSDGEGRIRLQLNVNVQYTGG